jgi:hypothetical protein
MIVRCGSPSLRILWSRDMLAEANLMSNSSPSWGPLLLPLCLPVRLFVRSRMGRRIFSTPSD